MSPFKQALNKIKITAPKSISFAIVSSLIVVGSFYIPVMSGPLVAIEVFLIHRLYLQIFGSGPQLNLKKDLPPLLIVSVLMLPSLLLLGAADSLILHQLGFSNYTTGLFIYIVVVMWLIFLLGTLDLRLRTGTNIMKSLDAAAVHVFKNIRTFSSISFALSLTLLIARPTYGLGYVLFFLISPPLIKYFIEGEQKKEEA